MKRSNIRGSRRDGYASGRQVFFNTLPKALYHGLKSLNHMITINRVVATMTRNLSKAIVLIVRVSNVRRFVAAFTSLAPVPIRRVRSILHLPSVESSHQRPCSLSASSAPSYPRFLSRVPPLHIKQMALGMESGVVYKGL